MKKVITILMICIFLCGCSADMRECKVVDKQYQPARTVFMPVFNGNNISLIPTYYPEQYFIIIEGIDENDEVHQRSVQVNSVDYEKAVIGQKWENEP